jgi:hypothetical protein
MSSERPKGKLRQGGTRTALDGSRVTDFEGPGGVLHQRFTKDGKTWWQSGERLCGLRDIDAARRLSTAPERTIP